MARTSRINDRELAKLVFNEGVHPAEAARRLGVSRQSVHVRLKELRKKTTKVLATRNIDQVVRNQIKVADQLLKINQRANELLDQLKDQPDLQIKTMAEIRAQLRLQLEIFSTMFDAKEIQNFQDCVLESIGEASPEIRRAIMRKLNETSAIRSAVSFVRSRD